MRQRSDLFLGLGLLAIIALGLLFFASSRVPPLSNSASGQAGLIQLLTAQDIDARRATFAGVDADAVGLRILPLLDTDLNAPFERPDDRETYLALAHERDISRRVVQAKMERLPTLLIAPKWSITMRLSGFAHPSLLADLDAVSQPFLDLGLMKRPLIRPDAQTALLGAQTSLMDSFEVTLFAPQLFPPTLPPGCDSLLGSRQGHLLLECSFQNQPLWLLSDPDMLNNHGLSLGENAATAAGLLPILAEAGIILVDGTTSRLFPTQTTQRAREWSDLLRFFAWPFSLIWASLAALLALALWRGARRFGPVLSGPPMGAAAARETSIAAKARLLRASGDRTALVRAHMQTRVAEVSRAILGQSAGTGTTQARLRSVVERRAPDHAPAFARALYAASHPREGASVPDLLNLLAAFEAECEKVIHDIGRA
ncbi:MAG: hypothetical protein AAFR93_01905 [Pseudomonadota bacterium]